MNPTYTIIKGDTLTALAERFNTTVDVLRQLNSEQIKNIDLIFDGQTLVLPEVVELEKGTRQALPEAPKTPACVGACDIPEYKDVVYIPEHPKTKKQAWLALTEEAQAAFKQEIEYMRSVVVFGDRKATQQNMLNAGVLDKFANLVHEEFLSQADKETYRERMAELKQLNRELKINSDNDEVQKYSLPQRYSGQIEKIKQRHLAKAQRLDTYKELADPKDKSFMERLGSSMVLSQGGWALLLPQNVDDFRTLAESMQALAKTVRKEIADEIKDLEKSAIEAAKKVEVRDGVKLDFYGGSQGYYTTNEDLKIEKKLKQLLTGRKDKEQRFSKGSYAGYFVDDLKRHFEFYNELKTQNPDKSTRWLNSEYLIRVRKAARDQGFAAPFDKAKLAHRVMALEDILPAIALLNAYGVLLKEQCLSRAELCQADEKLEKQWQDIDGLKDKLLRGESEGLKAACTSLGYYPVQNFKQCLDKAISLIAGEFSFLLGAKTPKHYLTDALELKKALEQREADLLKVARENAKDPAKWQYCFEAPLKEHSKAFLIWDEVKWKPRKEKVIVSDAGANSLQVVECFLASDCEKQSFVRYPCWILDDKASLKHVKDLTVNIAAQGIQGGQDTFDSKQQGAAKKALGEKVNDAMDAFEIDAPLKKDLDKLEKVLKDWRIQWQSTDLDDTYYVANAQAQFMRFSAGVTVDANQGVSKFFRDKSIKLGGLEAKADLDLFRAQTGFEVYWPNLQGQELKLPYIANYKDTLLVTDDQGNQVVQRVSKEVRREYQFGRFQLKADIKVYGVVGASCALATGIELGITNYGTPNIVGSEDVTIDTNKYEIEKTRISRAPVIQGQQDAVLKATGEVSGKLFAGVEAGGVFEGSYLWHPDSKYNKTFKTLGKFALAGSVSYAAQAEGSFKLGLDRGRLVFVMAAKLALGPGFGGKIGMEIDPMLLESFLGKVLGIFEQDGFRRLDIFEGDEDRVFELLNQLSTLLLFGINGLHMPLKAIKQLYKTSLQKENAPGIAHYILDKPDAAKEWVTKLLPETIAPLLTLLSTKQAAGLMETATHSISSYWSDEQSPEDRAKEANAMQRQALLVLLGWIAEGDQDNAREQYRKSLMRMHSALGEKPDGERNKAIAIFNGGYRLYRFFKELETLNPVIDDIRYDGSVSFIKFKELHEKLSSQYTSFVWDGSWFNSDYKLDEDLKGMAIYLSGTLKTKSEQELKHIFSVPGEVKLLDFANFRSL